VSGPSWNPVTDLQQMWAMPFMVNAYRAGTILAILAGLVGFLMVTRRQAFAGHTLSAVGFPGAAGATWLGVSAGYGYFAFCLAAALVIATVPSSARRGFSAESALVGTVQAFALACGYLFVVLYKGVLGGTTALLFGSFLGVTTGQVTAVAILAMVLLTVLAVVGRPLLFASLDPEAARASGVPVRALDVAFLVLLAATAAGVVQITGALMVFTLLVLPAAAARELTCQPARAMALSVALALLVTWVALAIAYYSPYPIGFWLSSLAFAVFLTARGTRTVRDRSSARVVAA
jgi:zinc/manganese transport system permease protein